ncbi:MAG: 16S rRNA (adenine(1518)-N(6)/adenine(1519)-N(6))-dimethyltransferase RsmA [Puniceicoccaceae bacterium]
MNRSELIDYFRTTGFHPSHRMGQNFLVDRNLAQKLVALAKVEPGSKVVEVGPGMGMITRAILETGASLWTVEKDERLWHYLNARLQPEFPDQLRLLRGDAVQHPLAAAMPVAELTVIANPPFAITGPWLAAVLDAGFPREMSLLLQKEAVDRLTARAGSKSYGVLPIRMQAAYDVVATHAVPPQSFYPAPSIDSQIVLLRRKAEPVELPNRLITVMQALFQQRRKQMGSRLRSLLTEGERHTWEHVFERNGLTLQSRPEQVPLDAWIMLARLMETG